MLIASIAVTAEAQTVDSTGGVVVRARTATVSPVLNPGELVRVWAPRARLDAALANFARIDSNLVITGEAPNPDVAPREWKVPIDAIERLEVWRGTPRSKTRIFGGIVLGALAGAGVGALATSFIECGGKCEPGQGTESPKLGAAYGAPIGALLGGVIAGASFPRWRQVTLSIR